MPSRIRRIMRNNFKKTFGLGLILYFIIIYLSFLNYFPRSSKEEIDFSVYWNVPTVQCKRRNVTFDDLTKLYGIKQNAGDSFRGDKISIIYDPGNFPALLRTRKKQIFSRNGGVPQMGNLKIHLDEFRNDLNKLITDVDFKGIAVIDLEAWVPIFRQNFGINSPYKNVSYSIEELNPLNWPKIDIKKMAAKSFEKAAMSFMKETLLVAKKIRPLAKWGYYGYPYCYNLNDNTNKFDCPIQIKQENNKIQWLWNESDALFPSFYLSKNRLNPKERLALIKGRVKEAKRISARTNHHPKMYPYIWYKYRDESKTFLTKDDLYNGIKHMRDQGLSGVIIWGRSKDVNTRKKCLKLREYVQTVLGPVIKQILL